MFRYTFGARVHLPGVRTVKLASMLIFVLSGLVANCSLSL